MLLEVAVDSYEGAKAALAGGADRIELCAQLDHGGTTPGVGQFIALRQITDKPICVMIRPQRAGSFLYSREEVRAMITEMRDFQILKPAGFVFGALASTGLELATLRQLRHAAEDIPCVFHRAIDELRDPADLLVAVEQLIELGFTRILSSGGAETALEGAECLAEMIQLADGQIEILPGGGVRAFNIPKLLAQVPVQQVHGAFSEYRDGKFVTSEAKVRDARQVLDQWTVEG